MDYTLDELPAAPVVGFIQKPSYTTQHRIVRITHSGGFYVNFTIDTDKAEIIHHRSFAIYDDAVKDMLNQSGLITIEEKVHWK